MVDRLLWGMAIFLVLLYGGSFFIQEDIYIERSQSLGRVSPDRVFAKIIDIRAWKGWNLFSTERGLEKFEVKYTDDKAGRAVEMRASDDKGNKVSIHFDKIIPNEQVTVLFSYTVDKKEAEHTSIYYLEKDAEDPLRTNIRWVYKGQFSTSFVSSPLKIFLLFSRYFLGKQMGKSLEKLRDSFSSQQTSSPNAVKKLDAVKI